ncbi:fasciclin domain-containing protein [Candidatus Protochlamydia sp. R18]|uniref:fasciclin domain-containing protein n=1 Tax=Candidatus Protochlamydia sp. R18 TaxID=1353977 RepID=UPI000694C382|nr:fasciclin domain-containing protein [Candidatus Protochlamydia sp. R18]
MQIFYKFIFSALVVGSLCNQVEADCLRCKKIEAERAKEQAEHPQQVGYYDDHISMADQPKLSSSSNSTTISTNPKSTNTNKLTAAAPTSEQVENQSNVTGNLYISENVYQDSKNPQNKLVEETIEESIQIPQDQLPVNSPFQFTTQTANSQTFSTLVNLLKTKDLLTTLGGSFTIFIPSNEALRALPPETLKNLFSPENKEQLSNWISNHIVPAKIIKKDIKSIQVKALSGKDLDISVNGDILTVNGVKVVRTETANDDGVMYVIDQVLFLSPIDSVK